MGSILKKWTNNSSKLRRACYTNSGMFGIWDCSHFPDVVDFDTWEAELLNDSDIIKHINRGHFVPVNIHSDGVREFEIRVGSSSAKEMLTEREKRYLVGTSRNFLFKSGGQLCLGGIEYVENKPNIDMGHILIPNGDYAVTVHLINWGEEPGSKDKTGKPTKKSLPDFVILVNPLEDTVIETAEDVETFPPPDA